MIAAKSLPPIGVGCAQAECGPLSNLMPDLILPGAARSRLQASRPKPAARVAEQLAHEPSEPGIIADAVTFHHVAKHRHVHVVTQQLMPRRGVQPLGFRKSAGNQPRREGPFQAQALAAGQDIRPFRKLH